MEEKKWERKENVFGDVEKKHKEIVQKINELDLREKNVKLCEEETLEKKYI